MAVPKQMKLHNLKVMTTSQHIKCTWCEYGHDPGREGICAACHKKFKLLLQATMWRRLRRAFLSNPDTAYCQGYKLVRGPDTVLIPCRQQIPAPVSILDHVLPWRYYPSLFWLQTNHQGLCLDCHAAKTQADGSFDHSPRRNQ